MEKNEEKKTCYQCKHRGEIPGSCHSRCMFNWNNATHEMPKGRDWGIKNGWFMWPYNFDPVWMIGECGEFEKQINK